MTEITIPAGTRVRAVSGVVKTLGEDLTVPANYRAEDDTWVFMHQCCVWEVKLHPGD